MVEGAGAEEVLKPPAAVGFIGLGQMGRPMASLLVEAGYSIRAFDASVAARRAFEETAGTSAVASVEEACKSVETIITMLPDGRVVREVLCGSNGQGAMQEAAPGTVVIDMSSSSPMDTQALEKTLQPLGFCVLDAPVSGGVKRAADGSLAIMVGGDSGEIQRIRPLLEVMGGSIFLTGPLGSGHAMKALNNFVSAAGFVAAVEAVLIGQRMGLDPSVVIDVLNASTGRNNSTENKMKQQVLSGEFASGFALALMSKDLHTAAGIARHLGMNATLAEVCEDLWDKAATTLGTAVDHTEIYRYLADLNAVPKESS